MADVVASVIGMSSFGLKLTDTLYRFGANFSAARDQTSRISERITDYTTILDILTSTIEDEMDFVSDEAIVMINRLCDQSTDLFFDIEDHLPSRRERHERDSISLTAKVMWKFRKSRVELLLGQLEYVKSNVLLLVMTTLVGQKIRSRRRRKRKSKDDIDEEVKNIQYQEAKARNAIVQHMNTSERLEELKNEAVRDDEATSASAASSGALVKTNTCTAMTVISHQAEVIVNFQKAMFTIRDPARRQAFVLENSSGLLEDLLLQWTCYVPSQEDSAASQGRNEVAERDDRHSHRRFEIDEEIVRRYLWETDVQSSKRKDLQSRRSDPRNIGAWQDNIQQSAAAQSIKESRREVPLPRSHTTPLTDMATSRTNYTMPHEPPKLNHTDTQDFDDGSSNLSTLGLQEPLLSPEEDGMTSEKTTQSRSDKLRERQNIRRLLEQIRRRELELHGNEGDHKKD